jgi:hypothetical protein
MRAVIVAIGKQGIEFFMNHYLQPAVIGKLRGMRDTPPWYLTAFNAIASGQPCIGEEQRS